MASSEGKHVMLSYSHKSKDVVQVVYDALRAENIPVWYDAMDMDANMYDGMAAAVHDATVVCCFMSPDYENSESCKMELEHAKRLNKRIIPCMMTNRKVWKPSPTKWLSLITGSIIAIDFSDNSSESVLRKTKELIERLRKDSVTSSTRLGKLFEPIRRAYLEQNRLKRIMNEAKSFPVEQSYINLSIVEAKEQQEKEKKLKSPDDDMEALKAQKDGILGTYEEIYGVKTSIEVSEIFEKCKDSIKKVLVLGRAGIGKSTFCQYVTYRWAKAELWTQHELVVLIHLRKLTESRYPSTGNYSPMDLVEKEFFPFPGLLDEERECFREYYRAGKILWILDGYDEFAQNIPHQLQDVFDHILQTQHHILTSRPYAIALSYEAKMEIIGFTDENIVKYVEHFFAELKEEIPNASTQGANLLSFLQSNMSIWGVAHIPVNLELICSLWSDTDWSKKKSLTMTMLYESMTEWLCRRYLQKQNIDVVQMRKKTVYDQCREELHFFETLAFNAMEFNDIILPATLLEQTEEEAECNLDHHPQLLNFGVLKVYDDKATGRQNPAEKQYYFTHLSFQEYFAARHLLYLLRSTEKQKAKDFIGDRKYNRRFLYVFIFASGLLAQPEYKACLQEFWTTLEAEPLDLVGFAHIKLIIECLDEVEGRALFPQSANYIKSVSKWIDIAVKERPSIIAINLLQSLQRTQSICNNVILQRKVLTLLESDDVLVKSKTLRIIGNTTITEPLPDFNDVLPRATRHQEPLVRGCAWAALGNVIAHKTTKEAIDTLLIAFGDRDSWVRSSACDALGKLGRKAATKEVIDAMLVTLRDRNYLIRRSACEVLDELGDKAATREVIDALVITLSANDGVVQRKAREILGNLSVKVTKEEAIGGLVTALRHGNWEGKGNACGLLDMLGEKAAAKEVIDALIVVLSDEEEDVRRKGCEALGKLGENAATKEVSDALIIALTDEDRIVRRTACEVLGKLNQKTTKEGVIGALIIALDDADTSVRSRAWIALDQLGEKVATKTVLDTFIATLRHEDMNFRWRACEFFGGLGEKAATKEIIDALPIVLDDENVFVRKTAWEALNRLGDKVFTKEVINAAMVALGDQDGSVRDNACKVLGKVSEATTTTKVINKLIAALHDRDHRVRYGVCATLNQLGAKAATKEVADALITALHDEQESVRWEACEALGNFGETTVTKEVINGLIVARGDRNEVVKRQAWKALDKLGKKAATTEGIVGLANVYLARGSDMDEGMAANVMAKVGFPRDAMKDLDCQTLRDLYEAIRQGRWSNLTAMRPTNLLNLYLETENETWLPLATYGLLLQGAAVTFIEKENKLKIYHANEIFELTLPRTKVRDALMQSFKKQKLILGKSCLEVAGCEAQARSKTTKEFHSATLE